MLWTEGYPPNPKPEIRGPKEIRKPKPESQPQSLPQRGKKVVNAAEVRIPIALFALLRG
jgi:hypothetical protein